MHVVIFEGIHWNTFAPLSLSRPVFTLATGMTNLLAKQIRHTNPTRLTLWVRPELADFCRQRIAPKLKVPTSVNTPLDDEPALIFSGRTLHFRKFQVPEHDAAVIDEGDIVRTARIRMPGLTIQDALERSPRWMQITRLPPMDPQTRLVERLWDLIKWNEESLIEDSAHWRLGCGDKPKGPYHMIDEENVCIGQDAHIGPGVVLDASRGPVVIDAHASIGANSVLQGPCYVASYASIMPLATIRPGTSIGMMCKVGGEVSNSIIFEYSNKAHEGYLGDSYVGKWVNLGAGTIVSNLKNTYGEITVVTAQGPEKTGRRFLGALIGDHAKTAIGTRLMAGSYVGFASMLARSGITPKYTPSFAFNTDKGIESYDFNKAIEVMKTVFSRRDRGWTELDARIVQYVHDVAPTIEANPAPHAAPLF